MWKRQPVVASAVGGIVDQIEDGTHGLLVDDPADLLAFGRAVESLIRDRDEARRLAENGRQRVASEFLGDRHLEQYGRLFEQLARASGGEGPIGLTRSCPGSPSSSSPNEIRALSR
jgi:trehalose synthase